MDEAKLAKLPDIAEIRKELKRVDLSQPGIVAGIVRKIRLLGVPIAEVLIEKRIETNKITEILRGYQEFSVEEVRNKYGDILGEIEIDESGKLKVKIKKWDINRVKEFFVEYGANLTSLNLGNTGITNAGLAKLESLSNLTSLGLDWCKEITDAGLVEIAKLINLTSLNLWGTEITDAGLVEIAKLTNLTSLDLWRTEITDAGLAQFKRDCPGVRIGR